MRVPGGDDVEFVTLMWRLPPIRGFGGKPDLEIAIPKDLSRTPRRAWQGERDGNRCWRRRAIHNSFPPHWAGDRRVASCALTRGLPLPRRFRACRRSLDNRDPGRPEAVVGFPVPAARRRIIA
jgi:hypothetical protein